MLVKKFCPKIFSFYLPELVKKKVNPNELDEFAFDFSIKKLGFNWFRSLFTHILLDSDFLRVWDCIFIHGFNFVQKFAVGLLVKLEKSYIHKISEELKYLKLGINPDSLIIAGNSPNFISQKRVLKLNIEKLIEKILTDKNFIDINREIIYQNAEIHEHKSEQRIERLRLSKEILENLKFEYKNAENFIDFLNSYENESLISRKMFNSITFKVNSWNLQVSTNFFVTFDQLGLDQLTALTVKIGLSLLVPSIDNKILLFYKAFKTDQLNSEDFETLIIKIEETFDNRNTFYKKSIKDYKMPENTITESLFLTILKSEIFFQPLINYLNYLDSDHCKSYMNLREIVIPIEKLNNSSLFLDSSHQIIQSEHSSFQELRNKVSLSKSLTENSYGNQSDADVYLNLTNPEAND